MWQPLTTESRTILGSLLAFALLALTAYQGYKNTSDFAADSRWVAHAHEVLASTEGLLSAAQSMESTSRGYALTGYEEHRKLFNEAAQTIDEKLIQVNALTTDRPRQQRRLGVLSPLIQSKRDWCRIVVETRAHDGLDVASRVVATEKGVVLMASIREVVTEMQEEETLLLNQRIEDSERNGRRATGVFAVLMAAAFAQLIAVYVFMRRDLIARKTAEQEHRKAAEEIHDLYDNAPCGYHSLDPNGVLLEVNDTELRWLGYAREEIVGKRRFSDLLSPESARIFEARYPLFKEQGWVRDLEFDLLRKDGSTMPVLLSATAARDAEGRYLKSRTTLFDRRDRLRLEEERERFFKLSVDMLCICGFDGRFKRLSPSWERTLGFTVEELMADSFMSFVHPDDRDRTAVAMRDLTTGVPVVGFENRYRCRDGSFRWMQWNAIPAVAPKIIYAVARDVSAQKQAESDLRRARDTAEAASKELEAFSYSVSHDLRAPLRSIAGFSQALLEDCASSLDAGGKAHLQRVRAATVRMGQLIDDLLELSRFSRKEMRRETVDLSALARDVAGEMARTNPGRQVALDIQEGALAEGDPRLLRVVMENLLENAWKFTSKREAAKVEFGVFRTNGSRAFFVRDDGAGFDMAYVGKLFGAFHRLHADSEFEGNGVGLATVARIIRRHEGQIWAEGAVGQGATFYFTLGTGNREPEHA